VRRAVALVVGFGLALLGAPAGADPFEDALPPAYDAMLRVSAREVLERAFENLWGHDVAQMVEMVTSVDGKVVRRQEIKHLRKRIRGRPHTLSVYKTANEYYGLRSLRIERDKETYDRFIFMPELQRVRRFSSAQRADKVLGTNLHLDDLETKNVDSYSIIGRSIAVRDGERVHDLSLEPLYDPGYASVRLLVEPENYAIREVRYFRPGSVEADRTVSAPAEEMVPFPDRILPSHWVIEDRNANSRTDIYFKRIQVDPPVDDRLFSVRTLEGKAQLPVFRAGDEP
jgi:hypothetical protein